MASSSGQLGRFWRGKLDGSWGHGGNRSYSTQRTRATRKTRIEGTFAKEDHGRGLDLVRPARPLKQWIYQGSARRCTTVPNHRNYRKRAACRRTIRSAHKLS